MNMKNIIYVLLVIVFFNCSFLTLYYLKIFSNLGLNNLFSINIGVLFVSYLYSFIYYRFFLHKFNFIFISFVGGILGLVSLLFFKNMNLEETLFIVTFSSFALTFLSYSIYFENKKELVFK